MSKSLHWENVYNQERKFCKRYLVRTIGLLVFQTVPLLKSTGKSEPASGCCLTPMSNGL